ncbi:MAG: DUF86 domain-containing protein [Candidatus Competibacter sp.]|nr:DUF86 domain-containing protein [Candidatus Competibacter sp.]
MSRDWLLYLGDLIESGEKIERFVSGRTFETFLADEAIFDAVLFNLQVIGEATKKLPAEARSALSEAGGSAPARLRDLIAHHYFALDAEIIWEVATTHVPRMLAQARELLKKTQNDNRSTDHPQ